MKLQAIPSMYTKEFNTTLVRERPSNDMVFCDTRMTNDYNATSSITGDSCYMKPDRVQNIFSTMYDIPAYVMYNDGMVSCITPRQAILRQTSMLKKICGENTRVPKYGEGIFIVTKYYIRRVNIYGDEFNQEITQRVKSHPALRDVNDMDVQDVIHNLITCTRQKMYTKPYVEIRVVNFIPVDEIVRYGMLYLPDQGLTIGLDCLNDAIQSPVSEMYVQNIKEFVASTQNYVEININDKENPNMMRYMKVGEHLMQIKPSYNYDKEDGCTFEIYRNDVLVTKETCRLDEMEEKLGIFNSKDQAKFNGDIKLKLDKMKIELEEMKLNSDILRIDFENKKLQHEIDTFDIGVKLQKDKMHMERELLKSKLELSYLEIAKKKFDFEADKKILEHRIKCEPTKKATDTLKNVADIALKGIQVTSKFLELVED